MKALNSEWCPAGDANKSKVLFTLKNLETANPSIDVEDKFDNATATITLTSGGTKPTDHDACTAC